MSERRTDDATLIAAVRILSRTIKTDDGVIPACLAEVADRLETLVEERRWVSVRERLPEEGVFVLWLEQDEYWPHSVGKRVGKFVNWGGDFDADVGRYTHWMPLPK